VPRRRIAMAAWERFDVLPLEFGVPEDRPLEILAIGAHADDIEIGCGETVLGLGATDLPLRVTWVVLSATGSREAEALESAAAFLRDAKQSSVMLRSFRDGFFPWAGAEIKEVFEHLKPTTAPDLILVPTWSTFRNHLVLEYETPKYDGDLMQPNVFAPLPAELCERKIELLLEEFPSQRSRGWFTADTFWALLRLRGVESNSPSRFAEGFHCRKAVVRLSRGEP
jgi:hypothetical protein